MDANFLIYQRDASTPDKQASARRWVAEILAAGADTATSWQCLREYYSVVTRKKLTLTREVAQADVRHWAALVPSSDCDDLEQAWRLEATLGFNFYDCLILASALNAGATHVLTEDLQHGQVIEGVRIVNPFALTFRELGFA